MEDNNRYYIKIARMPPKKSASLEKAPSKEKQTKLFSSQMAEEEKPKVSKTKSKQFAGEEAHHSQSSEGKWSYGSGKTPDQLFLSSWNVNGIRAVLNRKDLQEYLNKAKPDIICINETKIDEEAFNKAKIELEGYHGYWNFCKCSAGYSGVAIFSKYLPISLKEDLAESEHSQEGRVLTMEFEKFYLITAYIPNSGQKLDRLEYRVGDYDKCFQKHCEELRQQKTVIVCGDLNVCHKEIDIARPKGNEKTAGFTIEERNSFTQFLEKGWIDTFRRLNPEVVKYSWWSMRTKGREKNIGWRLDYFLVNEEGWEIVKDSRVNNEIMGSDHCPIELDIDFSS